MASSVTARFDSKRKRRWRAVLAALISLALVLSFFHGWTGNDDGGVVTVAAAQTSCDVSGKAAPDPASPHADHCLSHVTTVAPQDASAATIEYLTRPYRFAAMLAPEAADLASPFKPPRA